MLKVNYAIPKVEETLNSKNGERSLPDNLVPAQWVAGLLVR